MKVWWDESHQVVYFHALKDSCLEKHLYCVSVNRPGEVRILEQILFGSDLSSISAKVETDIREIKVRLVSEPKYLNSLKTY